MSRDLVRVGLIGVVLVGLAAGSDAWALDVAADVCDCGDRVCGDDGCGNSCGECQTASSCVDGVCVPDCVPDCEGLDCGGDGCGGSCGDCGAGWSCQTGVCVADCQADCFGKDCGDDGCGVSCGECAAGQNCVAGMCEDVCVPLCGDKQCGDDGCGGSCGVCAESEACFGGFCGPEPGVCGDGFCHVTLGENCANCAADCDCSTNWLCDEGAGVCELDPLYDPGCKPSTTAGCDDCPCEVCVCGMDPYCCSVKWDTRCVEECIACGTGCVPFGECGNGLCEPEYGEECKDCVADCGCTEPLICANGTCVEETINLGCTAQSGGGCGGCSCENCVCNQLGDSYCCNVKWDSVCVDECEQCGADCGGGTTSDCGNWWCQPEKGENCGNCPNDCYCNWFEKCENEECVVSGTNEGCWETYDAGCDNCACESCVCGIQPSCCEQGQDYWGGWDWTCVNLCQTQCGGCGPPVVCGDGNCVTQENCALCPEDCACKSQDVCYNEKCCTPQCNGKQCGADGCGGICGVCEVGICDSNGVCLVGLGCDVHEGPGCKNCSCQACVCEISPSCCSGNWDMGCASLCALDCGGCDAIPSCGDGICGPAVGENCSTCSKDCGCGAEAWCHEDVCEPDYCALGLGSVGCCVDDVLHLCVNGTVQQADCAESNWVCGWYAGSEQLKPGYYCGPADQVDVGGDPSGENIMQCPVCLPSCGSAVCGPDGCGGSCGTCGQGEVCKSGQCEECSPECGGAECGHDGCGGSCGECNSGEKCKEGQCVQVCVPQCTSKNCGPDGCGGECGQCSGGMVCYNGKCTVCVPDCNEKLCGNDGCGGSCGICPFGWVCVNGECSETGCEPDCDGKQCGEDGCGGSCGTCPSGKTCSEAFECVLSCKPDCDGKDCGSDGCNGSCGTCDQGENCIDGVCTAECLPQCLGKECGPDGCGGQCGDDCGAGRVCNSMGLCQIDGLPDVVADSVSDSVGTDVADAGEEPKSKGGCSAANVEASWYAVALLGLMALLVLRARRSGSERR